jgi:hypothetical protein
MKWPTKRSKETGKAEEISFGKKTQQERKRLRTGGAGAIRDARGKLTAAGSGNSRRKWWAFEGYTCVDVLLETKTAMIFVECKRNESLSPSTMWYPSRNQLGRNIEIAGEQARKKGKDFGVVVVSKQPFKIDRTQRDGSFPHLESREREELYGHYWGNVTWDAIHKELCPHVPLPENVTEAIAFGLAGAIH